MNERPLRRALRVVSPYEGVDRNGRRVAFKVGDEIVGNQQIELFLRDAPACFEESRVEMWRFYGPGRYEYPDPPEPDLFGPRVDLMVDADVRAELRPHIEADAVYA